MDMLAEALGIDRSNCADECLKVGSSQYGRNCVTASAGRVHRQAKPKCASSMQRRSVCGPQGARSAGPAPGWGFAAAYKNTGLGGGSPDKSSAEVELYRMAAWRCVPRRPSWPGTGMVLQMMVAEEFSVPLGECGCW